MAGDLPPPGKAAKESRKGTFSTERWARANRWGIGKIIRGLKKPRKERSSAPPVSGRGGDSEVCMGP